ncbi:MAG: LysR family transcriptional regulator [Rhodospirillales bacterium]|nr:LysR family transcriptional regulator [Rhodospirillales bacterium]
MDLRQARTFVTVAELGTVSKAALRLRIAQPALSRQISNLEQELGLKLFDRVGRRLLLTGEGEQILGDCRGLLNHASAVRERALLLRQGDSGVLRIAASPQLIESAMSGFLRQYARRFPRVQVMLTEALGWPEIVDLLERGEVHLGQNLTHALRPDDHQFSCLPLESVDLLAASAKAIVLGQSSVVDIAALAPHPLLLLTTGFVFRRTFDAACRLAGIAPRILFESRAPHTLLAMAESGHGVAIIPSSLRTQRYALQIVGLSYEGKRLREPLAIFWQRQRPLPHYATAFCEMFASYLRDIFPITAPRRFNAAGATKRTER